MPLISSPTIFSFIFHFHFFPICELISWHKQRLRDKERNANMSGGGREDANWPTC